MPPVNLADSAGAERSPYRVAMLDVFNRFATSPDRCKVLQGFGDYRNTLHDVGLAKGFQWINSTRLIF